MGLTVSSLYRESAKYNMKLLAGETGLKNLVTWIHVIETEAGAKFLNGNEIVITEGTICREEEELLAYVKEVFACHASAVILNIGMFILEVPPCVIDYCNTNKLPLFTVPWEVPLVDLTSDFCRRITEQATKEDSIASTMKNLIFKTGDTEMLIHQMERYGYMADSSVQFICISFEMEKSKAEFINESRKVKRIVEQLAKRIHDQYISFEYQEKRMIALIEYSPEETKIFIDRISNSLSGSNLWSFIHIGIGDSMKGLEDQGENFMRAYTACRVAIKKNEQIIKYQDMGLYRLLFNVNNKEILSEMYQNTFGRLEKYDRENKTDYSNFLTAYIECDGCSSAVSESLYIHRNTVNNYIRKISEILETDILSWKGKAELYTVYCIKRML